MLSPSALRATSSSVMLMVVVAVGVGAGRAKVKYRVARMAIVGESSIVIAIRKVIHGC